MINSVATNTSPPVTSAERRDTTPRDVQSWPAQEGDRVELSAAGETRLGPVRGELVQRIRAEIASGTYLTPEKLDAAIDRMIDRDLR